MCRLSASVVCTTQTGGLRGVLPCHGGSLSSFGLQEPQWIACVMVVNAVVAAADTSCVPCVQAPTPAHATAASGTSTALHTAHLACYCQRSACNMLLCSLTVSEESERRQLMLTCASCCCCSPAPGLCVQGRTVQQVRHSHTLSISSIWGASATAAHYVHQWCQTGLLVP